MKLFGEDGQSFELQIVAYQFPECETEDYDSNWLIVRIDVAHPRGSWSATDPCLLTYDVARLADWFERIGKQDDSVVE